MLNLFKVFEFVWNGMYCNVCCILVYLIFSVQCSFSQTLKQSIELNWQNDFFYATDFWFSNGVGLEYRTNKLSLKKLNKLFFNIRSLEPIVMNISMNHVAYTPRSISDSVILEKDRPYASYFIIKNGYEKLSPQSDIGIKHSFCFGLIGPITLGEEFQTAVHKTIDNPLPKGWHNQISNDIILQYQFVFNKGIFNYRNFMQLGVKGRLDLGTLSDKIGGTVYARLGKFNNPFTAFQYATNWQLYAYGSFTSELDLYDATLIGGVFSNSPHTLKYSQMQHLNLLSNFGITLSVRWFKLSYLHHLVFREYKNSREHGWGEIKLNFAF